MLNHVPDDFVVDRKILVGDHVAQACYLAPFNIGMLVTDFRRNVFDRFSRWS